MHRAISRVLRSESGVVLSHLEQFARKNATPLTIQQLLHAGLWILRLGVDTILTDFVLEKG
jgi:hypothetical protein